MLMKVLYVLLALSIVAIVAAVVAMLWRLRWQRCNGVLSSTKITRCTYD